VGEDKNYSCEFSQTVPLDLLIKVGWRLWRRLGSEEGNIMGRASWGT